MKGLDIGSDRVDELAAISAILLYGRQDRSAVYGTVHPVTQGKSGRATIGAGRPIDRMALVDCLRELAQNAAPKAEFLPETVLAVSQDAVMWWCRPAMRRVFFDCQEIGRRSAVVPHPGLVFRAASSGFSVFALQEDSRPTPASKLHEPPYFNTWDWGRICIGSAHVPKRIDVESIAGWESGFFESAFTHPNHGNTRVSHPKGEFAFWKEMLDGKYGEQFPKEALVSMDITLADLIASKKGDLK
ncbi:PRTRC system protein B [Caballeronia novacaledonica]|uniref:PRTRC system protein B n=1 Tax=Caballeronia novacaledonica TaxID=1544861 RepID=A0ACB5R484_9BURK|nr:PRTRC system protein B [Caballeronia sp. NK8]BCQ30384.1 PRTRC system protein B [Caballeronia sp. NK8]GJH21895.1 PRTRC system protein B [Caballeronia novacaledonica]